MKYSKMGPLAVLVGILLLASLGGLTRTSSPPTPHDPLAREYLNATRQAYRRINTYQATIHSSVQRLGTPTDPQEPGPSINLRVAFDRQTDRLSIDTPDATLVSDGSHLRLIPPHAPGHHVQIPAPQPLTYEALTDIAPFWSDLIPSPDVPMLMDDLSAWGLDWTQAQPIQPDPTDAHAQPGLRLSGPDKTVTIHLDPDTHLITSVFIERPPQPGQASDGSTTLRYQITVESINQPLGENAFAFDSTGSTAYPTLNALLQATENPAGAQPPHDDDLPMAPNFTLQTLDGATFNLDKASTEVVVLDFWATWCPPCRKGLPMIQRLHDWAREHDKPVSVYAVNLRETPRKVRNFWDKQGFTTPVLMDTDGRTAMAYNVQGIPNTVVIHRGRIALVHVGFDPNMDLATEIDKLLAE